MQCFMQGTQAQCPGLEVGPQAESRCDPTLSATFVINENMKVWYLEHHTTTHTMACHLLLFFLPSPKSLELSFSICKLDIGRAGVPLPFVFTASFEEGKLSDPHFGVETCEFQSFPRIPGLDLDCSHKVSLCSVVGRSTLLRSRMNPRVDVPLKSGRKSGRQAPTIPIDDSIMGQ